VTVPAGRRALVIPMARITDLGTQTQRKEASVGSKLLFGGHARSRQEEFITVSYELPDDAEAVVFRFEPKTSAAALAKIRFPMKKLGTAAAQATDETVVVPAPQRALTLDMQPTPRRRTHSEVGRAACARRASGRLVLSAPPCHMPERLPTPPPRDATIGTMHPAELIDSPPRAAPARSAAAAARGAGCVQ
jgi:hypothetical protein